MRRILLASVAIFAISSFSSPTDSYAIIVECANCSDVWDQAVEIATQAKQYATELSQLQTEISSNLQLVTAGLTLPMSIFAQVQGDIMQVRSIANAASVLTGNSGSILTRLSSASGYANQAMYLPSNIGNQITMWQQTLGNASNALGRTLGLQQGQENNYTALQAAIQAHSSSAAGQMQAIQAGNELAALTSTQLQQIQTTMLAAAQQQATRDIVSAERTAVEDAALQRLAQPMNIPTTGYKGY